MSEGWKGALLGAAGAAALAAALGLAFVYSGLFSPNADKPPGAVETWIAKKTLKASVRRRAPAGPNPLAATDGNLISGIALYKAHCAVCHGGADGKPAAVGRALRLRPVG